MQEKDIIIIGAGPAGLTAGLYGVRAELDTLVIESALPGGQIGAAVKVKNYPGFPDIKGMELAELMKAHAEKSGVNIMTLEEVKKVERGGSGFIITSTSEQYTAKAVIIATGLVRKKLGAKGEKEFSGRGVSYCATCDGPLFKGRRAVVIGSGAGAVSEALYLSDIAGEVKLVMKRDRPVIIRKVVEEKLRESKVELITNTEALEVLGNEFVTGIRVVDLNTKKERIIDTDCIFIDAGKLPNIDLIERLNVNTDKKGYIIVDAQQQTNIPGLYAAGDVCAGKVKQVGVAVGHGTIAALAARDYIKNME